MKLADLKWITPLLQAQEEGKTIQFLGQVGSTPTWKDMQDLSFNLSEENYRIKPEEPNFDIYVFKTAKPGYAPLFTVLNYDAGQKHSIKQYLESHNFNLLYIIPQSFEDHHKKIVLHASKTAFQEASKIAEQYEVKQGQRIYGNSTVKPNQEGITLTDVPENFIDPKASTSSSVRETMNPVEILAKPGTTPIRFFIYFNYEKHMFEAHRDPLEDEGSSKFVMELCLNNAYLTQLRDRRVNKKQD